PDPAALARAAHPVAGWSDPDRTDLPQFEPCGSTLDQVLRNRRGRDLRLRPVSLLASGTISRVVARGLERAWLHRRRNGAIDRALRAAYARLVAGRLRIAPSRLLFDDLPHRRRLSAGDGARGLLCQGVRGCMGPRRTARILRGCGCRACGAARLGDAAATR